MIHNKAIVPFLFGAALLLSSPSACLARRTRAAARRRLDNLQKKNARHYRSAGKQGARKRNRGRTCARDAAIEVILHAEVAILDIPPNVEDPLMLARYVKDLRDCAVNFLHSLNCATIEEDMNRQVSSTSSSPQMNGMKGRIMEENSGKRGIVITSEQCCRDVDAIRDMAAANIRTIGSSWTPDADGMTDVDMLKRIVGDFGLLEWPKKRFASALKTVGGVFIHELGNKIDPVCFSSPFNGEQKPETEVDSAVASKARGN